VGSGLGPPQGSGSVAGRAREAHRRGACGAPGNPDRESGTWAKKLADVDRKRSAYQDQQAEGLITLEELRKKLSDLEETRAVAQGELDALRSRQEHIEQLESDADTILNQYARMVPEALDALTSEERHRVYKMLRLKVLLHADGST
jgi:septal ring factor EnvC (AmiA/AmiB activator)